MKVLFAAVLMSSFSSFAQIDYDKSDTLYDVSLKSGKEAGTRTYTGFISKSLPFGLKIVRNGIVNFTDKCNNSYKDKRTFSAQGDCKYHNEQLIETFQVTDAKTKPNEILLGRRVYNRGTYEHYDLVTIEESTNQLNQKTVTVSIRMIEDAEAQALTEPKFKKESAFEATQATFVLTEVSQEETHLHYEYKAKTNHWLLNKEVMVPQVFVSISKGMNDLLSSVEQESTQLKRSIASK